MPTGYTYKVGEGKVSSFRDYALDCARAFGACITLRDEPDAPIPEEFLPDPYHKKQLTDARKELKRAQSMSLKQAVKEAKKEYELEMREFRKGKRENNQTRRNYESMLEKARNYQPPTPDHVNFRDFMVSQLEESIKFDCSGDYYDEPPKKQTGAQYKANLIERAKEDIAYHRKEHRAKVKRATERTGWVRALKDSLPEE